MANIYTQEWFEAVKEAINRKLALMKEVPQGKWQISIKIVGDGRSPYVKEGQVREFLVALDQGKCLWYKELGAESGDSGGAVELDYRFTGGATVFDEIAAGILDPIDAVLSGDIKVKGDMRFLLRQAEQVQKLLEAYSREVKTDWPLGKPPY